MAVSASDQASALVAAASKYGVPIEILGGVFGVETTFGQNSTTSSAGAVGDFQFLPSTARSYGYPLTNNPTSAQFGQQADAAANYLSTLKRQTGTWDAALQHYSGGGYGLNQVNAAFAKIPASLGHALAVAGVNASGVGSPITNANPPGFSPGPATPQAAVGDVAGAITGVFNQAVSDAKYGVVTLAAILVGAFMIFRAFSGGGNGEKVKVVPV